MEKQIELKADYFPLAIEDVESGGEFCGYASVFDVVDKHNDIIQHGAFEGVEDADVKLLWQHRADEPIGVITRIFEDEKGLFVEGKLLLAIEKAREAYSLLKSGAIKGLSIGYSVNDFDVDRQTGARLLKHIHLVEVSLVTFPANELANVTKVKQGEVRGHVPQTVREFEQFLREAGYSRKVAKAISSKGFMPFDSALDYQCEADDEYGQCGHAILRAISILNEGIR